MNKGIFWFRCFVDREGELVFTGRIVVLSVPCDEDGNSKVFASFNSRNGGSNTHKDSWRAVTAGRWGETKGTMGEKIRICPLPVLLHEINFTG